jgi:hypothetical protein
VSDRYHMPLAATLKRAAARWALTALAVGLGCTEKGRSLVLVDLSSSVTLDHVSVVVSQGDRTVGEADAAWTASAPLELGVFLPKAISGSVDVIACGYDAQGDTLAASPADPQSLVTATVTPGATTGPVPVALVAGSSAAICATLGGRAGGGGGGGGASGNGGSGATGGANGPGGANGSGGAGTGAAGSGGVGAGGVAGVSGAGGTSGGSGAGATGGQGVGGAGGAAAPSWHGGVVVAGDAAVAESFPSVAVDPRGNAVVVYQHGSGIWATRYNATANQWGTPGPIDARGGQTFAPKVAVDKNGVYLAVWGLPNDPNNLDGIWQSTSSDGVHWAPVSAITTTNAFSPVLSMNAAGAAVVAWTESTASAYQAAASIRPATGAAWSAPQVLRPGADYGFRNPAVAMSGTGQAFVGWEQSDGGAPDQLSVWMRQYTSAGWMPAALFESYDAQAAFGIGMSANTAGNAIVTYLEITATAVQIWSRRYLPATGFAAPLKVAEGSQIDTIVSPSVTLDESAIATVAFAFQIQSKYFDVYTNRSGPADAAWPTPMAMETDDLAQDDDPNDSLDTVTMPVVRSDPAGIVTLVWRKRSSGTGSRFDLWARRLTAGTWTPALLLETHDTDSVFWPSLGVGADGTAVAAWHYGTELDVWANVFR